MKRDERKTNYEILGVPADAPMAQIKAVYRRFARQFHPDVYRHVKGSSGSHKDHETDWFKQVTAAYHALNDPRRRAAYDASLRWAGARRPLAVRAEHERRAGLGTVTVVKRKRRLARSVRTLFRFSSR